jgi:hypothetical protein
MADAPAIAALTNDTATVTNDFIANAPAIPVPIDVITTVTNDFVANALAIPVPTAYTTSGSPFPSSTAARQ